MVWQCSAWLWILPFCLCLNSARSGEPADADARHWSFRPIPRPVVPHATNDTWPRNGLDAFILAKLNATGLQPAAEADRQTLIRRLTFDLTGLPPTPAEIDHFLLDARPDAYERLVDRLLASPHYGERWGQHWLDVVRYAETEGFEYDRLIPGAWRYRDYVIQSFNDDKPYDQFVREQLAGDERESLDQTSQVATGFYRLGPVRRNAGNAEVASSRNEVLTEQADSVGTVFLGLTIGCARCHDHKFDDISQADYYRFQAFLASTRDHDVVFADAKTQADWNARTTQVKEEIKKIKQSLKKLEGDEALRMQAKLKEAERRMPAPLPVMNSVQSVPDDKSVIHILKRGEEEKRGKRVGMRVLSALVSETAPELPTETRRPKTILARWVADPGNPLTARVIVNRVWQYHFGQGIVATANDFGVNGSPPSHPELLDYLAHELITNGWRLKPLHRAIVASAAYRQSSRSASLPLGMTKDPDNRLLWRFPRRRLAAEEIRDAMLQITGRLNRKSGGPSIMLPVDPDLVNLLYDPSQWIESSPADEHDRRSAYLLAKRNLRLPFTEVFDQPTLQTSCARREQSTHASQALELLNGKTANRMADFLAQQLRNEAGPVHVRQVTLAYRLVAGRLPTEREQSLAVAFLGNHSLNEFTLALFNLNAFLYVE